jgi:hypothetical protein
VKCMYICMYVCVYIYMYVCMYVSANGYPTPPTSTSLRFLVFLFFFFSDVGSWGSWLLQEVPSCLVIFYSRIQINHVQKVPSVTQIEACKFVRFGSLYERKWHVVENL